MAGPVYGAAGYQYPMSSALTDLREVRANGYPGARVRFESSIRRGLGVRLEEVGAVGGAPVSVVGYPESDGRRGYVR